MQNWKRQLASVLRAIGVKPFGTNQRAIRFLSQPAVKTAFQVHGVNEKGRAEIGVETAVAAAAPDAVAVA